MLATSVGVRRVLAGLAPRVRAWLGWGGNLCRRVVVTWHGILKPSRMRGACGSSDGPAMCQSLNRVRSIHNAAECGYRPHP